MITWFMVGEAIRVILVLPESFVVTRVRTTVYIRIGALSQNSLDINVCSENPIA